MGVSDIKSVLLSMTLPIMLFLGACGIVLILEYIETDPYYFYLGIGCLVIAAGALFGLVFTCVSICMHPKASGNEETAALV